MVLEEVMYGFDHWLDISHVNLEEFGHHLSAPTLFTLICRNCIGDRTNRYNCETIADSKSNRGRHMNRAVRGA